MKRAGVLLWLACAASMLGFGQDEASAIKTKIAALEGLWNQAYKAADIKALDGILDDGIVLVNDDGSMQSKAEFLASVKSVSPQQAQQQQVAPESTTVHLFGPHTAVAAGVMRVKGVENGKSYVRRERFIDTWILKDGRWVCIATDATPIQH